MFAQTVGDYRSSIGFFGNENWSSLAAWQRYDGANWVQPTGGQGYPGQFSTPTNVDHDGFLNTLTLDVTPAFNLNNFSMGGFLGFFDVSGNRNLVLNGNLAINALNTFTFGGTGSLTVSGTSTVGGTFTDNNNGGITRFVGTVTVSGTFTSTAVTTPANLNFRGGINNTGTFDGGAALFDTNNQAISGTSAVTFDDNVLVTSVLLTCSNSSSLTINGTTTLSGSGGFTDSSNGGVTMFVGNLNVGASTAFTSTSVTTTGNLVFRGGITNNGSSFVAGGATFNTNGQAITGATALSFANNVLITGITVTNSNTGNFTITGTTTLTNGGFTDVNDTGIDTFVGNVSQTGTSAFNTTSTITSSNLIFTGGITNNGGTFTGGGATFNSNNQAVAGNSAISFANLVIVTGITVTNNNTSSVTMSNTAAAVLSGTGTWTQGANSILNYAGSTLTVTTLNASNNGNTVDYNRAGVQTVRNPSASTYFHLTLSGNPGANVKSSSANHIISGNLTIAGTASFDVNAGTDDITVRGNWIVTSTNANPFVQGTRTVTLSGTAPQTLSTVLAGGETFNNLIINNTSATSPQITLNNAVTVTGILTMTDGNINLNGTTFILSNTAANALSHGLSSANGWMYGGSLQRTFAATGVSGTIAIGAAAGLFPMGSDADWRPFFVGKTALAGSGGNVTVSHTNSANTSIVSIADPGPPTITRRHDSFWNVSTSGISAGSWSLRAGGTNFGTIGSNADIRMSTSANVVGTHAAGSGGPTDWRVNRTGLLFGELTNNFHVSSTDAINSPLPIELISFTAKVNNDQVDLKWITASELNNDFFTVEKSLDVEIFEEVLTEKGAGTTSNENKYSAIDPNPIIGRSYYRLKQTDFDGTATFSDLVVVDYEGPSYASLSAFPNPSNGEEINLHLAGVKEVMDVPVKIVSMQGKLVFEGKMRVDASGKASLELSFEEPLAAGLYIVKAGPTVFLTQKVAVIR